jgi:hypothetical protein
MICQKNDNWFSILFFKNEGMHAATRSALCVMQIFFPPSAKSALLHEAVEVRRCIQRGACFMLIKSEIVRRDNIFHFSLYQIFLAFVSGGGNEGKNALKRVLQLWSLSRSSACTLQRPHVCITLYLLEFSVLCSQFSLYAWSCLPTGQATGDGALLLPCWVVGEI